ncbi:MAG: primosome, DnaD subunit, DNA segregation ATPase FtsK/SpoIIIE, S-DNA-T family [candidate division WS6 bacterium GW2011_GWC1_33_20]|uniref:Primosome, DnaD subunit, DNA segregation ATPase FtsK/SpoIIIE, S-DNA-T family n=1 Tax=candidate division WS6 bacterium GW2011_GWC1_33_20 TaxID=1619089 RepID=A0A0G0CK07_9BACT|nr:MAG: primosome, DnaD subunit, DNA segregation ATPase FtsK/SpoIIIE, S-DNA-T family [candidate division WS6 bacterium GW2011_GWC1_33_20]
MNREYIYLKDLIKERLREDYPLFMILGKDSKGEIVTKNLDSLLISGHTGSGKSVFLNSVIYTLFNTSSSEELELVLIDTKLVDFYIYEGIKYLKGKVNHTVDESVVALEECLSEIERRKKEKVRGPFIVVLIDEFADLVIQNPKSEELICKIAKEGKEVGIYIILSSSMASERVFTEKIKESIPKRLIGSVVSKENSLWLLDEEGAEELLGRGDMIFKDLETGEQIRVQTPFVSTEESEQIVQGILENRKIDRIYRIKDVLYEDAKRVVIESGNATASFLQRHFKIGYNQSIRLIDQLELNGVIGPKDGVKKREILIQVPLKEK